MGSNFLPHSPPSSPNFSKFPPFYRLIIPTNFDDLTENSQEFSRFLLKNVILGQPFGWRLSQFIPLFPFRHTGATRGGHADLTSNGHQNLGSQTLHWGGGYVGSVWLCVRTLKLSSGRSLSYLILPRLHSLARLLSVSEWMKRPILMCDEKLENV